jgi:dTDP-4-dehydrorhamnose reductase
MICLTVLITGGTGNLGRELVKVFPKSVHPTHAELEIIDEKAVLEYIKQIGPDELIHSAALTGVRRCENDKAGAYLTNVQATRNLVKATAKYSPSCLFVYISTASVFSCDEGGYTEEDIPNPKNFYSLTKLLGEYVVSESPLENYLILRVNFASREKYPYPKAFTDRYAAYLFSDDLAAAIKHLISGGIRGIVHVCGEERLSMFDFARITNPEVQPTTLKDYIGPPLPIDMTLRSLRIAPFKLTRSSSE